MIVFGKQTGHPQIRKEGTSNSMVSMADALATQNISAVYDSCNAMNGY